MMDTTECEDFRAATIEAHRLHFVATGNPVNAWRAVYFATELEIEDGARPALSDREIQDAFARLPPEILRYLSQCAARVVSLAMGIDWRSPPAKDDNGLVPNTFAHAMGVSERPPLSPRDAASLLPQALAMVSVGSNAFSKDRSSWMAEWAALLREQTAHLSKRERMEEIMLALGLADERSAQRLIAKGRKHLGRAADAAAAAKARRASAAKQAKPSTGKTKG